MNQIPVIEVETTDDDCEAPTAEELRDMLIDAERELTFSDLPGLARAVRIAKEALGLPEDPVLVPIH